MTYRARHIAQRVPASEREQDNASLHVMMLSLGMLAMSAAAAGIWFQLVSFA